MSNKKVNKILNNTNNLLKPPTHHRKKTSSLDSTVSTISGGASEKTPSDFEHKIDITYSKYLQSIAWQRILHNKNQQVENSLDEQLTHYSEELNTKMQETEFLRTQLKIMKEYNELYTKLHSVDEVANVSVDTDNIKKLTRELQNVCDKLYLKGLTLPEEEIEKLPATAEKLLSITQELRETCSSNGYFKLIENIKEIDTLLRKIKDLHKKVIKAQNTADIMVLRAVSMELSKSGSDNL